MKRIALSLLSVAFLAACSGGGNGEAQENETTPAQEEQQQEMEAPAEEAETEATEEEAGVVKLSLSTTGETMADMAYEPARLTVAAGTEVELTLVNKASAEAMIHNAVFIEFGKQSEVIEAGMQAGKEAGFVPEDHPSVVAATALAQPGETVTLTFTAPEEPGNYQYICTYPGHTSMKGILIVE